MNEINYLSSYKTNELPLPEDMFRCIFMNITDERAFDALSLTCKRVREIAHSIPLYQFHPLLGERPLVHFVQCNEDVNELIPILGNRGFNPDEASRVNLFQRYCNHFLVININQDDLLILESKLGESIYMSFESFCFVPNEKIDIRDHKKYIEVFFNTLLKRAKAQCINEVKLGNIFHVFKNKYEEACFVDFNDRISAFADQPAESITINRYLSRMEKITSSGSRHYSPESCNLMANCGVISMNYHRPITPSWHTTSEIQIVDIGRTPPADVERFFRNALLKHSEAFKKYALDCSNGVPLDNPLLLQLKERLEAKKATIENELAELSQKIKNAQAKVELLKNKVRPNISACKEISDDLCSAFESTDDFCDAFESIEDFFDNAGKYKLEICRKTSVDLNDARDSSIKLISKLDYKQYRLKTKLEQIKHTLERIRSEPEASLELMSKFYTELCIEVTDVNRDQRWQELYNITSTWQHF